MTVICSTFENKSKYNKSRITFWYVQIVPDNVKYWQKLWFVYITIYIDIGWYEKYDNIWLLFFHMAQPYCAWSVSCLSAHHSKQWHIKLIHHSWLWTMLQSEEDSKFFNFSVSEVSKANSEEAQRYKKLFQRKLFFLHVQTCLYGSERSKNLSRSQ